MKTQHLALSVSLLMPGWVWAGSSPIGGTGPSQTVAPPIAPEDEAPVKAKPGGSAADQIAKPTLKPGYTPQPGMPALPTPISSPSDKPIVPAVKDSAALPGGQGLFNITESFLMGGQVLGTIVTYVSVSGGSDNPINPVDNILKASGFGLRLFEQAAPVVYTYSTGGVPPEDAQRIADMVAISRNVPGTDADKLAWLKSQIEPMLNRGGLNAATESALGALNMDVNQKLNAAVAVAGFEKEVAKIQAGTASPADKIKLIQTAMTNARNSAWMPPEGNAYFDSMAQALKKEQKGLETLANLQAGISAIQAGPGTAADKLAKIKDALAKTSGDSTALKDYVTTELAKVDKQLTDLKNSPPPAPTPVVAKPAPAPAPAPAPSIGTAKAGDGTPGRAVKAGDLIVTGPNEKLQIILADKTVLTIGPNSRVIVTSFQLNPFTGKSLVNVALLAGSAQVFAGVGGSVNLSMAAGSITMNGGVIVDATVQPQGAYVGLSGKEPSGSVVVKSGKESTTLLASGYGAQLAPGQKIVTGKTPPTAVPRLTGTPTKGETVNRNSWAASNPLTDFFMSLNNMADAQRQLQRVEAERQAQQIANDRATQNDNIKYTMAAIEAASRAIQQQPQF